MEKIKPKTEKEEYELEDKDYVLTKAIQELTIQINILKTILANK